MQRDELDHLGMEKIIQEDAFTIKKFKSGITLSYQK
jgi:hypothetical protein